MKLLFPTVIHELKVKSFKSIKKDLVNFVYEEKVKDPDGVIFSNKGGWQSQPTYNSFDNILLKIVSETLKLYFENNVFNGLHLKDLMLLE